MKKFRFFGLKLILKLEKENKDDVEIYSEGYSLKEKIMYLMLAMSFIILTAKIMPLLSRNHYKKGNILRGNIYSPKTFKYNDINKRKAIVQELILTSKKEYIAVPEVEENNIKGLENFYDQILDLKRGKKLDFNYQYIEDIIGKDINKNIITDISKLKLSEIIKQKTKLLNMAKFIYTEGVRKEGQVISLGTETEKKISQLNDLETKILKSFIVPNLIYDKEKTENGIKEKTSMIGEQITEISAGSLIAKKGEVLTERKLDILSAAGIYSYGESLLRFVANIVYLLTISVGAYNLLYGSYKKELLNKKIYKSIFFITATMFLVYRFIDIKYLYLLPFEMVFFLLDVLVNSNFAFMMGMIYLAYIMPLTGYNVFYFIISLLSMVFGVRLFKNIKTRSQLISIGVQLSIVKFIFYIIITYFSKVAGFEILFNSGLIIISGIISGMLSISIVPYFEKTFNILTSFKLLELGDLSQPLLRDLSVKAPGTFYHSMMVATISENAAAEIGADSIFTRVASYYHDIGKLKRPKFFVENQEGGENLHKGLTPSLSALIILSHTKEGVELGKAYMIPKEIRDIMYEHQGTTLLTYFYNKAKQDNLNIREEDFRYSGPKPRTKESAIIMLADSVEAAVRSLDKKTYTTIEEMIRKVISGKIEDGQLSDADLTFKEIEIIIKVFTKTLIGIHHVRIKYPGQKK